MPVTRIRDLHYGDVLFYFYQGESFEALTRLLAYDHWRRLPNHRDEAQLLLGGLYLELGLHNEAGRRFEQLLAEPVPQGVRDRAWFYLAKVWYARGYDDRAEQALRRISAALAPQLEAERQHLLANVLMRQSRFAEAADVLTRWQGPQDWTAFARFNLGVAFIRQNQLARADPLLTAVGTLESTRAELLSLRDKANLALGFAYIQAGQPEKSRAPLLRVRLNGPHSNKALLGLGWADAALGNYREALNPWLELQGRNLLDAAVQESYLAVPYALAKLDATAQAAEYYERAVQSFADEGARIDEAVLRVRGGALLDSILAKEADGARYGWFWQLREVPDAPESRYLYLLLAGHDFQEGLKNYRDMAYLDGTLTRWHSSIEAFNDMIATRDRAFAERIPQANALLAREPLPPMTSRRDALRDVLENAQRAGDVARLGTSAERAQWARIAAIEAALHAAPQRPDAAALRERLRLVKGVLYWRVNQGFRGRVFATRRRLQDLDQTLAESAARLTRLAEARDAAQQLTGAFAERIAALQNRLSVLHARLDEAQRQQSEFLAEVAARELTAQKDRLETYQVQARFALASIYDRAANPPTAAAATSAPQADAGSPDADESDAEPVPDSDAATVTREVPGEPSPAPPGAEPPR
ncbi:MAG: hypothetical protein NZM12_00510 [Steroidobacteraceae bacterium]|nr:hypothetical protein [Steroidobacteraceae bacterium]MDW8259062.1 hypothetical protein [Gammaproteobacteria bacterium]